MSRTRDSVKEVLPQMFPCLSRIDGIHQFAPRAIRCGTVPILAACPIFGMGQRTLQLNQSPMVYRLEKAAHQTSGTKGAAPGTICG